MGGEDKKTRQEEKAMEGIERIKHLHDQEIGGILEHEDALKMNKHRDNPEQSTPQARSDLPKHKHYEKTGHGKKGNH